MSLTMTRFRLPRWLLVTILPAVTIISILYMVLPSNFNDGRVVITVGSRSESLEAIYKCAYENRDGSVDLIFNIPKGGEELVGLHKKLASVKEVSKVKVITTPPSTPAKKNATTNETQSTPGNVRSLYPISLDADYEINTVGVCPLGEEMEYIVIVHSATAYFNRRRIIRETYGGRGIFGNIAQRLVFLLGRTSDPEVTRKIREEALLYKDIVQGAFSDSYHNLTHKGVLGFRWVSEFCPQAKFVVKLDDDVFMNPFRLVKYLLPSFANKTRTIGCHLRKKGTSPITRGKGKWQVGEMEFKGLKHYPFDYCNGYFVLLTRDLIRPMLNAARINPFFWIDDVYLFGLLPATVGKTTFVNLRDNLTLRFETGRKCLENRGWDCPFVGVSQWIESKADHLWYRTLMNLTTTSQQELTVFGVTS